MAKKFPSELTSRGTVKTTDKLMIHNIDTGETCYCTVAELLAAIGQGVGTSDSPTFASITCSSGIINGHKDLNITALDAWFELTGTGGMSGIIHLRDTTSGGSVVIMYDPNGGGELLAASQITGFTVDDLTNTGSPNYTLRMRLTSGTTPRNIQWTLVR